MLRVSGIDAKIVNRESAPAGNFSKRAMTISEWQTVPYVFTYGVLTYRLVNYGVLIMFLGAIKDIPVLEYRCDLSYFIFELLYIMVSKKEIPVGVSRR